MDPVVYPMSNRGTVVVAFKINPQIPGYLEGKVYLRCSRETKPHEDLLSMSRLAWKVGVIGDVTTVPPNCT